MRATVKAITDAGGEAIFVATDVSKAADVEALVAAAESELGGLHVMTANAGILGRGHNKTLVDLSEEEIDQIMGVNFMGVVFSFKYAIPVIRRSGGGAMTATASLSAIAATRSCRSTAPRKVRSSRWCARSQPT